jgi:hypothetical protein
VTLVHLRVDHQARRVERVPEHAVQRQVPGSGLGLVREEAEHRLGRPFLELDLRVPGTHPAQIPGERVREDVLPGAVEAELSRQLGRPLEDVPRERVDLVGVDAVPMRHQQVQIIAARARLAVDQQIADRARKRVLGQREHVRMHGRMADEPARVGLDDAQSEHGAHLLDSWRIERPTAPAPRHPHFPRSLRRRTRYPPALAGG